VGGCKTRGPLRTAGQNRCLLLPADLVLPDRPVGFVYVRSAVKSKRASETEAVDALVLRVRSRACHSFREGGGDVTDALVRPDSDRLSGRARAPAPTAAR
jgi:hypothetical protein